jgi:glutathione S-transferase
MVENKPTLGYWKIRGLAQQIRYLLSYVKVEWNEVNYEAYPNADGTWDRTEWTNVKSTVGDKMAFPNLPYFFDGDLKLSETNAIMRHICRKHKPELLG